MPLAHFRRLSTFSICLGNMSEAVHELSILFTSRLRKPMSIQCYQCRFDLHTIPLPSLVPLPRPRPVRSRIPGSLGVRPSDGDVRIRWLRF